MIIRVAFRALQRNKMRAALTMLGIIIGVAAVIAMVGVGQGAQKQVQDQIAAMGSNMLYVGSGTVTRGGMHMGWGATKTLVMDDVAAILRECRASGILTIGTATTPDEAVALEEAGVDAIAASGFEAGGHRGSFLGRSEDSLMGTLSLVPQVVDAVDVPVIAAGGIADARGVVAALALGAEGVQMGTAFLACEDSGASRLHRKALRETKAGHTGLTRGFTGRLARGIRNRLMAELNSEGTPILPYPLQRALVRNLSVAAEAAGRADLLPLWSGQSAPLSTNPDAQGLLRSLVEDVGEMADAVADWSGRRRGSSRGSTDTFV